MSGSPPGRDPGPRLPSYVGSHVAAKLSGHHSVAAFLGARHRLEDEEGMPAPVRGGQGVAYKWRADALLAWAERRGSPKIPGVPAMRAEDLAQDRAVLRRMARTP